MPLPWTEYYRLMPKALRVARERAGLGIEDAAAQGPINQVTISSYELGGKGRPWLPYFLQLLDIYGLDLHGFHELIAELQHEERPAALQARIDALESAEPVSV